MKRGAFKILIIVLLATSFFSGCYNPKPGKFVLVDAKISTGIDDKFMPINITDRLPADTSKVYCWFQWRDAPKDTKILARWHYVTDDVLILDYTFVIPKKNGVGSVSLEMPQGKTLPVGMYRVDLLSQNKIFKSSAFRIKD